MDLLTHHDLHPRTKTKHFSELRKPQHTHSLTLVSKKAIAVLLFCEINRSEDTRFAEHRSAVTERVVGIAARLLRVG